MYRCDKNTSPYTFIAETEAPKLNSPSLLLFTLVFLLLWPAGTLCLLTLLFPFKTPLSFNMSGVLIPHTVTLGRCRCSHFSAPVHV